MTVMIYPTVDVSFGDTSRPSVYAELEDGSLLIAGTSTSRWVDELLEAGMAQVHLPPSRRRQFRHVSVREAKGEELARVWTQIHEIRPDRSAARGPDSGIRLLILTPA